MKTEKPLLKDRDMQVVIGNIMRWGVFLALGFAAVGGIIFLVRHGGETALFGTFTEQDKPVQAIIAETIDGLLHFKGRSYIMLGILILFATPVIRVLFSLFGFILEKDRLYILITLIVLGIICISVSGGLAH